ncbi:MAG: glycosyltransferase [Sedimentisphaerales bacterium]|nr:glycosyltransferase [Sedimentisphaerales bacterium]
MGTNKELAARGETMADGVSRQCNEAGGAGLMVSAVIPSKGRPEWVARLVGDLRRQDYPEELCEIIVVDDGSSPAYELEGANVRVIRHERSQGAQASRNEGIAAARGEIVFMLDDDIELLNDDYISKAVRLLNGHPEVGAVFGRKIDVIHGEDGVVESDFSLPRPTCYSGEMVPASIEGGVIEWGNQVYLIRKAILERLGGYDGIYGLNGGHSFREESDLHARVRQDGHTLWYLPDIGIKHHVVQSGGHGPGVGSRLYWIAHNHVVFVRRHFRYGRLRSLGFLFDVLRYNYVQGRFRYLGDMLRGYWAGWRNAARDEGPGRNEWLERL